MKACDRYILDKFTSSIIGYVDFSIYSILRAGLIFNEFIGIIKGRAISHKRECLLLILKILVLLRRPIWILLQLLDGTLDYLDCICLFHF